MEQNLVDVSSESFRTRVDELGGQEPQLSSKPEWLELRILLSTVSAFCASTIGFLVVWALGASLSLSLQPTVIESGSMEPAIERGDIVMFAEPAEHPVEEQMIIQFRGALGSVVHRVVAVDQSAMAYTTQGDANLTVDSASVPYRMVEGVGVTLVPMIGYPLLWVGEGELWRIALVAMVAALILGPGMSAGRGLTVEEASKSDRNLRPLTAYSFGAKRDEERLFDPAVFARMGSILSSRR